MLRSTSPLVTVVLLFATAFRRCTGRYSGAMSRAAATINYVELPAAALEATKTFYATAFGWSWIDYGPTYTALDGDGVTIGLNALAVAAESPEQGAENSIGPLVLLETKQLEVVASNITAGGGEIVTAIYGYPGGHRFHFQDPSGNILGVYQSGPPRD